MYNRFNNIKRYDRIAISIKGLRINDIYDANANVKTKFND
jgi:hypothetical protein